MLDSSPLFLLHSKLHGKLHACNCTQNIALCTLCTLHTMYFAEKWHFCALLQCALIISQDWCKKGEYFIQPLPRVNRENSAKIGKNQQSGAKSICNQIQMELSRLLLKVVNNPTICFKRSKKVPEKNRKMPSAGLELESKSKSEKQQVTSETQKVKNKMIKI